MSFIRRLMLNRTTQGSHFGHGQYKRSSNQLSYLSEHDIHSIIKYTHNPPFHAENPRNITERAQIRAAFLQMPEQSIARNTPTALPSCRYVATRQSPDCNVLETTQFVLNLD